MIVYSLWINFVVLVLLLAVFVVSWLILLIVVAHCLVLLFVSDDVDNLNHYMRHGDQAVKIDDEYIIWVRAGPEFKVC
jgi:hypothetical protein